MYTLIEKLNERKKYLEMMLANISRGLAGSPDGVLRLSTVHEKMRYYQVLSQDGVEKKKYLPASEKELVKKLGQKAYLLELKRKIEIEIDEIENIILRGIIGSGESVFHDLPVQRQCLVTPYMVDNETYAQIWLKRNWIPNEYRKNELIYLTKRGELVRTKAEVLIADTYFDLNIPYIYEMPVEMCNGEIYHIDFTALQKSTRKVVYHEHMGLLDDSGYRRDNMQKLDLYRRSGIYVGKNLILTHETAGSPLNIPLLRDNLRELFC
ncbi:MAG: hypothetical protein IKG93_00315 [Clostridiales bacterium]|nr:hypothetical protein [Clostridiales bacterium]